MDMLAGEISSFGQWLKARRKSLDLTQNELAQQVGCSVETVRKLEADTRRPSRQIAELLAEHLHIFPDTTVSFVQFARAGIAPHDAAFMYPASSIPQRTQHNLPEQPTPLIGRESDIAAICKQVSCSDTRLLTLLGPPGIGKTRLSLAAAERLLESFAAGVCFVALAAVRDVADVANVILQALGVGEDNEKPVGLKLHEYLRERQMLLVLDNCEQISDVAPLVAELLSTCAWLKIVVTSRTPLRLRREHQFPVPPLSLPDINQLPSIDTLSQYAAIELFIERSQAVKPDFSLTEHNALAVATICHRLDGLPLAIELISARVNLLPPAALLQRLHGGLILRSNGQSDFETRHQTLNAAIEWSYRLLNPDEQSLFRRLGVFMGGCTLEAIEAICSPPMDTLNGVASLTDNNLLRQEVDLNGEPRFVLLETIREYALERLQESGEEPALRQSHADYYVALAERAETGLHHVGHQQWLNLLETEHNNLRAVFDWCEYNHVEQALLLAVALSHFWEMRGHMMEGRERFECLLAADSTVSKLNSSLWAKALNHASELAWRHRDDVVCQRRAKEALQLSLETDDNEGVLWALFNLGRAARSRGDDETAREILEEGLALARKGENHSDTRNFLSALGIIMRNQGDYARAIVYHDEAVKLAKAIENKADIHIVLWETGTSWLFCGDCEQAQQLYMESLTMSKEAVHCAYCLEGFSGIASAKKQPERAARLLGAAGALRDTAHRPRIDSEDYYRHILNMTRAQLDEPAFNAAWAEGRAMTLEQALAYALSDAN